MILSRLTEKELGTVDKILGWLLILLGFVIAMAIAADPAGWEDPVFTVVRRLPYTPYSWAGLLAIGTFVYGFGERSPIRWRSRGRIIIVGALLCSMWWLSLSLMMARMVYEEPTRITILWPFCTFFCAVLYATRIIVYADAFSGDRWRTNPYQLWGMLFVVIVSLAQIIIGVAPGTIFTEVEHPVQLQLALVNFLGSIVVLVGLHLKNTEKGINLELAGTLSLVATVAWYCASVTQKQVLAGTTLGFGLAEAFLFATFHRGIQIITLKYARVFSKPGLENSMKQALNPDRIVVVKTDEIEVLAPEDSKHGL